MPHNRQFVANELWTGSGRTSNKVGYLRVEEKANSIILWLHLVWQFNLKYLGTTLDQNCYKSGRRKSYQRITPREFLSIFRPARRCLKKLALYNWHRRSHPPIVCHSAIVPKMTPLRNARVMHSKWIDWSPLQNANFRRCLHSFAVCCSIVCPHQTYRGLLLAQPSDWVSVCLIWMINSPLYTSRWVVFGHMSESQLYHNKAYSIKSLGSGVLQLFWLRSSRASLRFEVKNSP